MSSTLRMPAVGATATESGAVPRVIVCSGTEERRDRLSTVVRGALQRSAKVFTADGGAQAIEQLAGADTDCLVCDARLSDMRAAELLTRLGADNHIPVIVVFGEQDAAAAGELLERGVLQVCPEACDAALSGAVRCALEQQRLRALLASAGGQLQKLRGELNDLERLDPLTGVINNRAFYEVIATEYRRSARAAQPLSLLIADLDCFTAFNFTYGREEGDRCLQRVADCVARSFQRAGDTVARIAGGAFTVLLTDGSTDDVAAQAERLRQSVWDLDLQCSSSRIADRLTVSIGVATVTEDFDKGWEHLFQAAQAALYHAKAQGRNWVEIRYQASEINADARKTGAGEETAAEGGKQRVGGDTVEIRSVPDAAAPRQSGGDTVETPRIDDRPAAATPASTDVDHIEL